VQSDDYEYSGDDVIKFEDCVLAIENGGDSGNIQHASNRFVVESEVEKLSL
jgi:hypothetical protein